MAENLLKDRLKQVIKQNGTNASELARQCGLKPSFIYDILNGKSTNPSTAKMARVSEALGTDLSSLLGLAPAARAKSEYVMMSSMLVTQAAAGGKVNIEEKEAEPYYFRQSWVTDRLHTSPENLRMIFVEGDSMEPTLCQGDMVLVDITRKNPSPPGIFVLFDGMALIAKRLEFLPQSKPPSVRILSDNTQYQPYERKISEVQIIGRVVWFAREI